MIAIILFVFNSLTWYDIRCWFKAPVLKNNKGLEINEFGCAPIIERTKRNQGCRFFILFLNSVCLGHHIPHEPCWFRRCTLLSIHLCTLRISKLLQQTFLHFRSSWYPPLQSRRNSRRNSHVDTRSRNSSRIDMSHSSSRLDILIYVICLEILYQTYSQQTYSVEQ